MEGLKTLAAWGTVIGAVGSVLWLAGAFGMWALDVFAPMFAISAVVLLSAVFAQAAQKASSKN
jgi:hypothetical protein